MPIVMQRAPAQGNLLLAFVAGSAAAGALAPPDGTWRALDAPITTQNGLIAASWWKIASSTEPSTYTFESGSGGATDYCSGVIVEVPVANNAPIDLHVVSSGTVSAPAEATTPTAQSPAIGDVVIAAIATQAGADSAGYGVGAPPNFTLDQDATPRTNALMLAHATNTAPDSVTPYAFAIQPGSTEGDFVGFLAFIRASAGGGGGGGAGAFLPGSIARTTPLVTSAAVQLQGVSPTGGVAPYTYQWHRSTTVPFAPSPSTALAGQTMLALNDQTVAPGTRYAYVLVMGDSSSPVNSETSLPQLVVVPTANQYVGVLGDGIAYGVGTTIESATQAMQNTIAASLATITAPKLIGTLNQAIPQTATRDWLPGGSLLGPAVTAFKAASVQHVVICLGTEDARDDIATAPADFVANLRAICAYLIAEMPGIAIIVNFPPAIDVSRAQAPFSVNSLGRLASFLGVFAQLTQSGLPGIAIGDLNAYVFFAQAMFAQLGPDGVHPNDMGAASLGALWARAFIANQTLSSAKGPLPSTLVSVSFPTS